MREYSILGNIAVSMKKQRCIWDFNSFVELCTNAAKNIQPLLMEPHDFYKFVGGQRARKSKYVTLPQLSDIREVEFRRECRGFYFRCALDQDQPQYVDFLKPSFNIENVPEHNEGPRGITSEKKAGILKLIPANKAGFWTELPVNDKSTDLVTEFN